MSSESKTRTSLRRMMVLVNEAGLERGSGSGMAVPVVLVLSLSSLEVSLPRTRKIFKAGGAAVVSA